MLKHRKKYRAALEKIEPGHKYDLASGVEKIKELAFAKFDETVELTVWLGVDPRKADQLVRGTLVLPHGIGKSKTVLVIAQGRSQRPGHRVGDATAADLHDRLQPVGQTPQVTSVDAVQRQRSASVDLRRPHSVRIP